MKKLFLCGVILAGLGLGTLSNIGDLEAQPAKSKKSEKLPKNIPYDEDAPEELNPETVPESNVIDENASKDVTIQISSTAPAVVYYGKKKLGKTPLTFTWPRDSGPLDLALKANGYFTVYTRAYTFRDEKFTVKMTPLSQAHTLFGYKAKIETPTENDTPSE